MNIDGRVRHSNLIEPHHCRCRESASSELFSYRIDGRPTLTSSGPAPRPRTRLPTTPLTSDRTRQMHSSSPLDPLCSVPLQYAPTYDTSESAQRLLMLVIFITLVIGKHTFVIIRRVSLCYCGLSLRVKGVQITFPTTLIAT